MLPQQKNEITYLSMIVITSIFVGYAFDQISLFITLALSGYIFFMLKNLFKLHNWMSNRKKELPEAQGYWGEIFNELYLMEKKSYKQKKITFCSFITFQKSSRSLTRWCHNT